MKTLKITLILTILCVGVFAASRQSDLPTTDTKNVDSNPSCEQFVGERQYDIGFQIEETSRHEKNLHIEMKLYHNSHYVSPNAQRDFKGKFTVSVDDNPYIRLTNNFLETPRSVEEIDPHPFVDGTVNWVRVNTTYDYSLELTSTEDFEVEGQVQFVIEPNCTLEKTRFLIYQEGGFLKVENKTIQGCKSPEKQ